METKFSEFDSESGEGLETFLRGMETAAVAMVL